MNDAAHPPVLIANLPAALPQEGMGEAFLTALLAGVSGALSDEGLDAAMGDRPSPRLWLVMHRHGQEDLGAQVAAALAAACAARGQAVVVVDTDEEEGRLTERAGRRDHEGWVDMIRYGASLAMAGVPLPLAAGRGYFVGVGSFTPTEATDAELERLLGRLRHQADDVILVSPCGAAGRRLARLADLRLLCWDRSVDQPQIWALAAQDLERFGRPVTTLVVVGTPASAAPAAPMQESPMQESPVQEPPMQESPLQESPLQDAPRSGAPRPADPAPEPSPPDMAATVRDTAAAGGSAPAEAAPPLMAGRNERPRRSSAVFWVAALAVVALISVLVIYNWRFIGPNPRDAGPVPGPAQRTTVEPKADQDLPQVLDQRQATALQTSAPQTSDEPTAEPDSGVASGVASGVPSGVASGVESEIASEVTSGAATQTPSGPQALDRAAFSVPVGRDGWALHLYSLPDSAGALQMAAQLERLGFTTAIRTADLPSGHWYRVLVGSFATRAAAAGQLPALLQAVKEDWASPVKF